MAAAAWAAAPAERSFNSRSPSSWGEQVCYTKGGLHDVSRFERDAILALDEPAHFTLGFLAVVPGQGPAPHTAGPPRVNPRTGKLHSRVRVAKH